MLFDLVDQIVSGFVDPGYLSWTEVLRFIPGLLHALQPGRYLLNQLILFESRSERI